MHHYKELILSKIRRSAKIQKRPSHFASHQENTIRFDQTITQKQRHIDIIPRTRNQERLVLALQDSSQSIVITAGPAGTGKTYLAVLAAIKALRNGDIQRIVLTRPAVEVDEEKHGFLPGDLNQKMMPWCIPLFDVLKEYYRQQDILSMMESGIIEIAPLAYMRGRSLKDAWIIADESQNMTPTQMVMLLTRIGKNSKIIVTGDVEQTDRKKNNNGLIDLCKKLKEKDIPGIAVCELDAQDIQRHPIIGAILKLYAE